MRLIRKMLRYDRAVYWGPGTETDDNGKPIRPAPVEIKVRWVDVTEEQADDDGNTFLTKSVVYVDRDLERMGVLWHGRLKDADTTDPFANTGASTIRGTRTVPDMKNKDRVRKVFL